MTTVDQAQWRPGLRESYLFDRNAIAEIQRAAREGIYDIRGFGAKRRVPHFDDLLLLGASISRYPLEGYRERCDTNVVLGSRFARKPIELKIPVTIAGIAPTQAGLLGFDGFDAPDGVAMPEVLAAKAEAPPKP